MAPLLARALEKESDTQIEALLTLAHAQANLGNADPAVAPGGGQGAGRDLVTDDQECAAAAHREGHGTGRQGPLRGHRRRQGHRRPPGAGGKLRTRFLRPLAGQHPAAGGARAGDHLRRDGHHQHGARRIADDRCLCHLRHAEPVPRLAAGVHRLVSAGRHPGRLLRRRAGRRDHGTHGDPLALRPHAGNPARHLGPVAGADPGGARDCSARRTSRSPTRAGCRAASKSCPT